MSKLLWKSLLVSPALLGAVFAASSAFAAGATPVQSAQASQKVDAQAAALEVPAAQAPVQVAQAAPAQAPAASLTQIRKYSNEGRAKDSDAIGQVTSVSQLSDVQPTDWAFQALQSLVERYGVIAGYPDGTYRGNRALTRYEFAAGLNAALDRVNELIAAGTADLVTKEDLATLQRLQEEFAAELATLRGRVDALEARTATLEAQQFSTTTKLVGEAIFEIASPLSDARLTPGGARGGNNIVFQDRVRLALQTSFTGKDLLVTRLDAGNAGAFALPGGSEATRATQFNPGNNNVALGWLAYYLPLGDKGQLYIPAYAGLQYDYAPTYSPYLDGFDGGSAALSIFGQRNPIYNIGGGSGLGLNYKFNNTFGVSLGYMASNGNSFAANVPSGGVNGGGLFGGNATALAQLNVTPSDSFGLGLTYVYAYRQGNAALFDNGGGSASITGYSGTALANNPGSAQSANAYGASAYFKLSPQFTVNGWVSYITSRGFTVGDTDIWTYALGLAFPDLGKKGNLGGIIVGVQPYAAGLRNFVPVTGYTNNNPIHIEGFYKYQVSDNISITPGVIWIIAPGQNTANDNVVVGTLRTTFTF